MLHLSDRRLTKKPGEKRNERDANQSDPAAGHELLDTLAFCARVVITVPFQKVYAAPDAQPGSEGDDKRLQYVYRRVKEFHAIFCRESDAKYIRPLLRVSRLSFQKF